jgi:hypothetical protein
MSAFHRLAALLFGISLAVFALPGVAKQGPTKQYSLTVAVPEGGANYTGPEGADVLTGPVTVAVTVKNESPPSTANSNISSFKFTLYGQSIIANSLTCPNAQCMPDPTDQHGNTVIVTNISPPIQPGPGYVLTLQTSSCGDVTAPVGQTFVYSGSQLTGTQFAPKNLPNTVSVRCGAIPCTNSDVFFTVPDSTNPVEGSAKYVTGLRGQFDKNGACVGVNYDTTNTIPTDNTLHFAWDTTTDDAAVFAYQVNVNNGDPAANPVKVSWLNNPNGTPSFIVAPFCNSLSANPPDDLPLPAPYGALAAAVKANDKSIKIDTSQALVQPPNPIPAEGFPIVVDAERMQVTKITTNAWTVTRNAGVAHTVIGTKVMSTPLPLLTGYVFDDPQKLAGYNAAKQAQVCIANQSAPVSGVTTVWIIDIGDAWILGK